MLSCFKNKGGVTVVEEREDQRNQILLLMDLNQFQNE